MVLFGCHSPSSVSMKTPYLVVRIGTQDDGSVEHGSGSYCQSVYSRAAISLTLIVTQKKKNISQRLSDNDSYSVCSLKRHCHFQIDLYFSRFRKFNILKEIKCAYYPEGPNLPEITLSVLVFKTNNFFFYFRKNSRWTLKWEKSKILDVS